MGSLSEMLLELLYTNHMICVICNYNLIIASIILSIIYLRIYSDLLTYCVYSCIRSQKLVVIHRIEEGKEERISLFLGISGGLGNPRSSQK